MIRPVRILVVLLALAPFAARATEDAWLLVLVDGAAPGYAATLALDPRGRVFGRAPCNRYSAALSGTFPEFRVESVMSTKMACADMAAEQTFFDLLARMERIVREDGELTLSGDGHVMVFSRAP